MYHKKTYYEILKLYRFAQKKTFASTSRLAKKKQCEHLSPQATERSERRVEERGGEIGREREAERERGIEFESA